MVKKDLSFVTHQYNAFSIYFMFLLLLVYNNAKENSEKNKKLRL